MKIEIDTLAGPFDRDRIIKLRLQYGKAVKAKKKNFKFEGTLVRVDFAKYLLEYANAEYVRMVGRKP